MTHEVELTGEVAERQERLDGDLQLTLDGGADEAPWSVSASLSWLLGREGALPLTDGDLTLLDDDGDREANARLAGGEATLDPDTAIAVVTARFIVDTDGWLPVGSELRLEAEVGAEEWRGRLLLPDVAEDA